MSLNKAPELFNLNVLSPEINNLSVLVEGRYSIGFQIKAVGTKEQIKNTYGEATPDYSILSLEYILREHSEDVYQKELNDQTDTQEQKKYIAEIKQKFPIGSVVTLKSGGPKMTIEKIDDFTSATIHTVFYLDNREITQQKFIPEVLKLVPDKKDDNPVS